MHTSNPRLDGLVNVGTIVGVLGFPALLWLPPNFLAVWLKERATMLARIGVMRALNRSVERVFNPPFDCRPRKTAFKGCLFVRKTELALHTLNNGHYRLVSLLPIGSSELYAFEGPICIEM
jgi:hypothetical protein